jgi:hypothetical protein
VNYGRDDEGGRHHVRTRLSADEGLAMLAFLASHRSIDSDKAVIWNSSYPAVSDDDGAEELPLPTFRVESFAAMPAIGGVQ